MGRYVFKLPDVGEGTAEAEIVAWHVKVGDHITADQNLVDVMTDKATVEMTSPVTGQVVTLHGEPGEKAIVGAPLVELEIEGAGNKKDTTAPAKASEKPKAEAKAPEPVAKPAAPEPAPKKNGSAGAPITPAVVTRAEGEAPLASPAVRGRAHEIGIELQYVPGTGPGGRISHEDLDRYIATRGQPGHAARSGGGAQYAKRDGGEDIKIIGLRRKIAEKMQESKHRIPHFAYVAEVDVTEVEDLRAHLNKTRRPDQPKLTLLPFLMRALVRSIPEFPQVNARFDDDNGIVHRSNAIHIGIATQTPNGLLVPVVRHAEALDVWGAAVEVSRLAAATRDNKATKDELSGSTITITSLGPLGGVVTTPVINHPEVAIIGPNAIVERPVVRDGQIVVRKMMNLSSSFDHRVVDGYDAAVFINRIKALLEHPATLFMEFMTEAIKTHVLVVGGGPGGYVAAIRAGQLGLDTTIVEADRLGGTCLIRGCIPSKAIIHVAEEFETMRRAAEKSRHGISLNAQPALDMAATVKWKETVVDKLNTGVAGLLKRAKVRAVAGWANFSDGKTCTVKTKDGDVTIHAEHVILANGSLPVELPFLKFGGNVISSTEALTLDALPKNLVVVGAGYIGLELGIAFAKFGVNVTVVEALDRILPLYDKELTDPVRKWLEKHGVTVHLGAKAKGASKTGLAAEMADGKTADLPADKILVTVGRRPNIQGWGLENMAVDMDGKFIRIDDQCRTSMKNVWAIGDITGEPMLAHRASAQGEMVAEIIAGHKRRFDPVAIAAVCFTEPEIVSAGKLPSEAPDAIVARFPFVASGRALSMDAIDGFVRIVADKTNHRVLGIHAVGSHVSELSAEFALALEMGATLEDIAGTIHVHPTLSEAFHESALLGLYGHAIHI